MYNSTPSRRMPREEGPVEVLNMPGNPKIEPTRRFISTSSPKLNQFIDEICLAWETKSPAYLPAPLWRFANFVKKTSEKVKDKYYYYRFGVEIYEKDGDRNLCWTRDGKYKGHYFPCGSEGEEASGPVVSEGTLAPRKKFAAGNLITWKLRGRP